MSKIFQSTRYTTYSTRVSVNGKAVSVVFDGGDPSAYPPIMGKFKTSDEALIQAMENSHRYGIHWVEFIRKPKIKKTEKKKSKAKIIAEIVTEQSTIVNEVANVQQARNYLIQRFPKEFNFNSLKSKLLILKAASEKNIVFPNITE